MLQDGRGFADAWNFGPPEEASVAVREVVDKVIELWGGGQWEDLSSTGEPHEARNLRLDIGKARQSLMWVPVLSFDEALDMTVSWYKHHHQTPEDILGFTLEQIKLYSERAVKSGR
jgi:CDP-glucose 4,6-dehydratase